MTGPVVGADPRALRDVVGSLRALAEEIDDALVRLDAVLDAEGRCWGTDEPGLAFEAAYAPASTAVRSLLGTATERIEGLADAIVLVAAELTRAEAGAASWGA